MDFVWLTSEIVKELIRKSGVQEALDAEKRAAITSAAIEMAAAIMAASEEIAMANAIYIKHGSEVVFGSEVGDDVAWSTENIADGAGRQATLYDQGAEGTARPEKWQYRFYTQAQATPTVGNICDLRLKTSDGTHPDNDDGATDAAVSAEDKLKNLSPLKPAIVDEAAANIEYVSRGTVRISHRYFAPVLWNDMGSAITNDAAETKAVFTPAYDEVQ